jgi:hypothetical protein
MELSFSRNKLYTHVKISIKYCFSPMDKHHRHVVIFSQSPSVVRPYSKTYLLKLNAWRIHVMYIWATKGWGGGGSFISPGLRLNVTLNNSLVYNLYSCKHRRTGRGGRGGAAAAPKRLQSRKVGQMLNISRAKSGKLKSQKAKSPQFVGQTKAVGQYSLHSRAILAYYKRNWDKLCKFCG